MPARFVVAQYGRSLILSTVGRHLGQREGIDVVVADGADLSSAVASLAPDVLLIDLQAVDVAAALAVVDEHPDVVLVGLEPSGARLVVLAGRGARTVGVDELVELIERRARIARGPS